MSHVLLALLLTASPAAAAAEPPGGPQAVEGAEALAPWFEALRGVESGGVARALHYGDSTIAADGIARTVRARLADRFGSAGPGFVPLVLSEQYHSRSDVVARRSGAWRVGTILYGNGGDRYGLGGVVGIGRHGTHIELSVPDGEGGVLGLGTIALHFQRGEGYGQVALSVNEREPRFTEAEALQTDDAVAVALAHGGVESVQIDVQGGPVPLYGVVLETGEAGTTWEQLGVVGVGSRSFARHAGAPLADAMRARDPDLVVVMLGGNEAGYPTLSVRGGEGYRPIFDSGLETILAGKGDAACLVVSPLDQGFLEEQEDGSSKALARPGMENMITHQRAAALDAGCAWWSTWDAMGGEGSALTWGRTRGLGAGDFVHVTAKAQDILGNRLSDALLTAYDEWSGGDSAGAVAPSQGAAP